MRCRHDALALTRADGGNGLVGGRARLDLDESYGAAAPDDQVKFARQETSSGGRECGSP
jgi:hypothetical protein